MPAHDIVTTAQLLLNTAAPGAIASLLQPNFQDPGANAMSVNLIQQAMARQAGAAMPLNAMPSFLELPIPGAAGRNAAGGLADMMADPAMLMRLMGGQLGQLGGDGIRQLLGGAPGGVGGRMAAAGGYLPSYGGPVPYSMPTMGAGARGGMSDEMMSVDPRELNSFC